jgi:tetratricopeptide (TPR) repeat protein
MTGEDPRECTGRLDARILEIGRRPTSEYAAVKAELEALAQEIHDADLPGEVRAGLTFMLSSALINAAGDARDQEGLALGTQWARELADDPATPITLRPHARLNKANGLQLTFSLAENRSAGTLSEAYLSAAVDYRVRKPHKLTEVRACLSEVANDPLTKPQDKSHAQCNLANVLDDSGRWVEAYAAYLDALKADPTNGNAAGNIALLLYLRLRRRVGQKGHLAAVYNHYVQLARSLRARTVEIGGEGAAQLFDQLQPMESSGHFAHSGNGLDEYQQWIVEHRLALAATVEGLGSDSDRWDSAMISGVAAQAGLPRIFAAFNVLKAEYLVARRLAFRGMRMIDESAPLQHEEDTGTYPAGGDGGYYGEGPSTLVLAQRCALDILDKIAVAANEHFNSGLKPEDVRFASYWIENKQPRPALPAGDPGRRCVLALAELAEDVFKGGMHHAANMLRNAGTHRIVHVTYGIPTGPTKDSFSSIDVDALKAATMSALWVTRAAYLYFVDLLDSQVPKTGLQPAVLVMNQT